MLVSKHISETDLFCQNIMDVGMITILFLLQKSIEICLPGSSECIDNEMKMCDINGDWVTVDCPKGTECNTKEGKIGCVKENQRASNRKRLPLRKRKPKRLRKSNRRPNKFENDQPNQNENLDNSKFKSNKREPKKTITIYKPADHKTTKNENITAKNNTSDQNNILDKLADLIKLAATKTVTITERTSPKEIKLEYTTKENGASITNGTFVSPTIGTSQNQQTNIENEQKSTRNPPNQQAPPSSGSITQQAPQSSGSITQQAPQSSNPLNQQAPPSSNPPNQQAPQSSNPPNQQAPQSSNPPNQQAPQSSNPPNQQAPPSSNPPNQQAPTSSNQDGISQQQKQPENKPQKSTPSPGEQSPQPKQIPPKSSQPSEPDKKPEEKQDKKPEEKQDKKPEEKQDKKPEEKQDKNQSKGGNMIDKETLSKVMKESNFAPKDEFVDVIVQATNESFTDKSMAAQFLAQTAHESGGFQYIEEIACAGNKCSGQYGSDQGAPGKQYYGRGFIQLSWPANYKAASQDLLKNTKLYDDPDSIAKNPKLGADVSIWFWKKNVEGKQGVGPDHFGYSTKAINGELECKNNNNIDKSKKRYEIYKKLAKAMKLEKVADESGCYTG
ncbi:Endochitinase [Nucleospora cyclopteri]